ncbi:MAG: hypothetical protein HYS12_17585 [Planctomycetes bacterium]|nr:hypothetical protein [Planctomycetota bacterium]
MAGRQDSKDRRTRAVRSVCACCLLALAGCGGGSASGNKLQSDPLLGNQQPVPVVGAGAAVTAAPKSEPAGPLPAMAAPTSAVSTAALATASPPLLDNGRDLRVGPPPTAKLTGATPVGATGTPNSVPLSTPAGNPSDGSPLTRLEGVTPVPAVGGDGAWSALVKRLQDRGMTAFRLELQRDGLWRCGCSIPDRRNPSLKQTYNTSAADATSALRAVVEEVERSAP